MKKYFVQIFQINVQIFSDFEFLENFLKVV